MGYPGWWSDQTNVRFDGFVTDTQRGEYLKDNKFTLKNERGEEENYTGEWILLNGGYLNWSTLICPLKSIVHQSMSQDGHGGQSQ